MLQTVQGYGKTQKILRWPIEEQWFLELPGRGLWPAAKNWDDIIYGLPHVRIQVDKVMAVLSLLLQKSKLAAALAVSR